MYGTPRVAVPRPLDHHFVMSVVMCKDAAVAELIVSQCERNDPMLNIIVGISDSNMVKVGGHMGDLPNAASALATRLERTFGQAWRVEPWA